MLHLIPVSLKIQSESIDLNSFLEKFTKNNIFSQKSICKNYFSIIIQSILLNENPIAIIKQNIPDIEGIMHFELIITTDQNHNIIENHNINVFLYRNDMNDQEFNDECLKVKQSITTKLTNKCSDQNKSLGFIRNLLSPFVSSKDKADLYFIKNDYKNALFEYSKIQTQYPELSKRMCEVCRILLNNKLSLEPLAFDIYIEMNMFDRLFDLSNKMPFDAKLGIQYYLIGKNINDDKKMILLHLCYKNFKFCKDERSEDCYVKLKEIVEEHLKKEKYNEKFWNEFLNVFKIV